MCWFSIAKYLLFAFNFVLWAAGCAVLGVGIWMTQSGEDNVDLLGITIYESGGIVLIVAGSCAFLIGFLGCCGASKESTCLLGIYFTLVLIIVIAQVAVGIWAILNFDSIDELVDEALDDLNMDNTDHKQILLDLQKYFDCCGKNDTCASWNALSPTPSNATGCECNTNDYSANVCKSINTTSCTFTNDTDTYVFSSSCDDAIVDWVSYNMEIIAGIGIGIGLIEIFGLVFSMCMCQSIKEKQGYA